ncbi:MAG: hypothetical protein Q4P08_00865 [Eubacteriales bacterium]|nr:hypothetical protein [Eubacteriales bacterium]
MSDFQAREKRQKYINWSIFPLVILALFLDSADFLSFGQSAIRGDFIAALVFVYTILKGGRDAFWLALICGYLRDYLAAPAMGVGALPLLFVYAVAALDFWPSGKLFFRLLQFLLAHYLAAIAFAFTSRLVAWQLDLSNSLPAYLIYHLKLASQSLVLDLLAFAFWYLILSYSKNKKSKQRSAGVLKELGKR